MDVRNNDILGPFRVGKIALKILPCAFVAWTFKVILHLHQEGIE